MHRAQGFARKEKSAAPVKLSFKRLERRPVRGDGAHRGDRAIAPRKRSFVSLALVDTLFPPLTALSDRPKMPHTTLPTRRPSQAAPLTHSRPSSPVDPRTDRHARIAETPGFVVVDGPSGHLPLAAVLQQTFELQHEDLPPDLQIEFPQARFFITRSAAVAVLHRYCRLPDPDAAPAPGDAKVSDSIGTWLDLHKVGVPEDNAASAGLFF